MAQVLSLASGSRSTVHGPSSMACWLNGVPTRRLWKKTKVPEKSRRKRPVQVSKVEQAGLVVPKARKAFALFLKEKSCVKPGASKLEFAAEMKRLGKVWSSLKDAEKAPYQDRSNAEFLARRTALLQMGVPLRPITGTAAEQKESQPQLHDPEPAAGAMVKLGVQYEINTILGEGTYGKVFAGKCQYGSPCALKVFSGLHARVECQQEVQSYRLLDEKLNVKERRFFPMLLDANHCGEPWPWMALALGGPSLATRLGSGKLSPDMVSIVANQLQSALRILHQQASLLHLDVKPSNCLWLEEIQLLQLCDLGMAEVQMSVSAQHQALGLKGHHGKVVEQPRLQAYVTALYRPPELFNLQNHQLCTMQKLLSPAVDMWSYGCVVYEAAAGKPLMKLAKPANASAQRGVAEWCQHYKQMCGKGYQKMLGQHFKTCFPARLSVHDCWAEVILNACAPEPMLRRWKQAVVKSV